MKALHYRTLLMFVHYLQTQCELFYGQSAVTPAHHQRAAQLQVKVQQSHLNFDLT